MGSSDQPEIRGQPVQPANPAVGPGFEQAQQLDLQRQRQLADFIQKKRAAACCFDKALFAMSGAGKCPLLVAEEFAFEQRFGHSGAVDRNKRPLFPRTGFMNGVGYQFLAGTGFSKQQNGRIGVGDPQHLFQHGDKGRRAPDQPLRRRPRTGLTDNAHGFDEIDDLPLIVTNRRRFDIDVLFAARRVMQVQDALRCAGIETLPQGAGFAGLITGHIEMMRNLVTETAGNWLATGKLAEVSSVGGDDPVIRIHHDAGFGQPVKKGKRRFPPKALSSLDLRTGIGDRNTARRHSPLVRPAGCLALPGCLRASGAGFRLFSICPGIRMSQPEASAPPGTPAPVSFYEKRKRSTRRASVVISTTGASRLSSSRSCSSTRARGWYGTTGRPSCCIWWSARSTSRPGSAAGCHLSGGAADHLGLRAVPRHRRIRPVPGLRLCLSANRRYPLSSCGSNTGSKVTATPASSSTRRRYAPESWYQGYEAPGSGCSRRGPVHAGQLFHAGQ